MSNTALQKTLRLTAVVTSIMLLVIVALWLTRQGPGLSKLERVQARGQLVMLTRNSASAYYVDADGPAGLEYDLAKLFAEKLGVELKVKVKSDIGELVDALSNGKGDFIAAGLSITKNRQNEFRFGPSYQTATPMVVYRQGQPEPDGMADLQSGKIGINAGSSYIRYLQNAQRDYDQLDWIELEQAGIEDMLQMIAGGELDYSVIDSTDLALNLPFYPHVKTAFALGEPEPLAWMFRQRNDDSLLQAAREHFFSLLGTDQMQQLLSKYYDQDSGYDEVETLVYINRIRDELPLLRQLFMQAADDYELDWRLLAAVAYQESHWQEDAVSPTGVRGIMMLTQRTAGYLGVEDREDPAQSIDGGARYLRMLIDTIPQRIASPDRVMMALAAYNIGLGHLEDARVLTERLGGDPDSWEDVREHFPLLSRQKHFENLQYGYAHGNVAVHYVDNIQTYLDILVWMESRNHPLVAWNEDDIKT